MLHAQNAFEQNMMRGVYVSHIIKMDSRKKMYLPGYLPASPFKDAANPQVSYEYAEILSYWKEPGIWS